MMLWKSMRKNMKSVHGKVKWKVGQWQKVEGEIKTCSNGFHASERIIDAMGFVNLEVLARVEVRGESIKESDKQAWSEMKIVKAYHWKKEDSVAMAIYSAELVIRIWEKDYPDDKRPREAIEAAKKWLKKPTEKNRKAAWSAWYAMSAGSAGSARSAAWSAWSAAMSAAESAWSAAMSAAWSAWSAAMSAAESAWSAAMSAGYTGSAAYEKTLNKIEEWILKRVKTLEETK